MESMRSINNQMDCVFWIAFWNASSSVGNFATYLCAIVPEDLNCGRKTAVISLDVLSYHHPT